MYGCPFCNRADIEYQKSNAEFQFHHGIIRVPCECESCGVVFLEEYRLATGPAAELAEVRAELEKAHEMFTGETTTALLANILRHFSTEQISRLGRTLLVRSGDIPAELEHEPLAGRAEIERLKVALEHYADKSNWNSSQIHPFLVRDTDARDLYVGDFRDGFQLAKEILQKSKV